MFREPGGDLFHSAIGEGGQEDSALAVQQFFGQPGEEGGCLTGARRPLDEVIILCCQGIPEDGELVVIESFGLQMRFWCGCGCDATTKQSESIALTDIQHTEQ